MTPEGTPQREITSPLEASLDQFGATLFHHRLQMDKGMLWGKRIHGGEQQLKNTLMETGSQAIKWRNLTILK